MNQSGPCSINVSDADVTELVLTSCFYVCVSRFLKSAAVQLEAEYR